MKQYKQTIIQIDKIKPYAKNPKIHNSEQIAQIMQSIKLFGFTTPLLIDSDFNLLAGHGRLEALKQLNRVDFKDAPIKEVNAVIIDGLSEFDKKALIILDNKIAENAIWDENLLRSELTEILDNSDFDLKIVGFSDDELTQIFNDADFLNNDLDAPKNNPYTKKIATPIYEPKGILPNISELCDTKIYAEKIKQIQDAEIPQELKEFLKFSATRFLKFDFAKIAEFYAHQDRQVKEIFENLLLVFIDYNRALEAGYIELVDTIEKLAFEGELE